MQIPQTEVIPRHEGAGLVRVLILCLVGLFGSASVFGFASEVNVRDFGAIPNDGQDDAPAIRGAIAHAIGRGIPVVVLVQENDLSDGPADNVIVVARESTERIELRDNVVR